MNYYIINALHYQKLVVKHNVINDYKKVAFITYVFLFNIYYWANEIKVWNLLDTYVIKYNMLFSTILNKDKENRKYSEAYVFPSKKDIKNEWSITEFNFVSLYSSFIMVYNFSLEKIILNEREADNT